MIDEDELEQYCINLFKEDGWSYLSGYTIAPEEPDALRSDYREVALLPRLLEAVQRLNPTLPPATFEEVARTATKLSEPTLERNSHGVSPIYFVFLKPSTLSSLFPYARD